MYFNIQANLLILKVKVFFSFYDDYFLKNTHLEPWGDIKLIPISPLSQNYWDRLCTMLSLETTTRFHPNYWFY